MSIVAFIIGLALPACTGYLLLSALEGRARVLGRAERWTMGCVCGLTLTMLLTFAAHAWTGLPLTFTGFGTVQAICLLLAGAAWFVRVRQVNSVLTTTSSPPLSRTARALCIAAFVWIALKVIVTGTTFLLLTPTYLDDSLDNWNLRAKVYFVDQALTLVMPGEDPTLSPEGVSSYPPAVPLAKTWLATINGSWSDALANAIHIVWFIAALVLVYAMLRRTTMVGWSALGVYLLGSMPLYLMHGTNAYADAFLSVHVFMAVAMVFAGLTEEDAARRMSFLRLGACTAALLAFTKNEGLLVFLPPVLLILVLGLAYLIRHNRMSRRDAVAALAWYTVCILIVALPWLIFKWSNDLTFGNAKPFTTLGIGWQENVLLSVAVNTFFEGNWLLLFPLLFGLLLYRRREAFGPYLIPTAFFLIVYLGQMLLFLFTGLSAEALRQTGYARGLVQLMPVIILLTTLLLEQGARPFLRASSELAQRKKLQVG